MLKNKNKCTWRCTPLIIYLILSVVSMLMTIMRRLPDNIEKKGITKATILLSQIVGTILWGGFIAWLCQNCHEGWAWFIVFLPVILGILIIISLGLFIEDIITKIHN